MEKHQVQSKIRLTLKKPQHMSFLTSKNNLKNSRMMMMRPYNSKIAIMKPMPTKNLANKKRLKNQKMMKVQSKIRQKHLLEWLSKMKTKSQSTATTNLKYKMMTQKSKKYLSKVSYRISLSVHMSIKKLYL